MIEVDGRASSRQLLALGASLCALGVVFLAAIDQIVVGVVLAVAGSVLILAASRRGSGS